MRPTRLTTKFTASALIWPGAGWRRLVRALPCRRRAADDDVPIDTKIFRGILEGLGLRKDGEAINYQERAPLVIPPSRALPPPEKADAALANNPAWPKDPDVARRKIEAEHGAQSQHQRGTRTRAESAAAGSSSRPAAIRARRRAIGASVNRTARRPATGSAPSELGTKGQHFQQHVRQQGRRGRQVHRRAAARRADRAAARLPDAVAGPALWPRQRNHQGATKPNADPSSSRQ